MNCFKFDLGQIVASQQNFVEEPRNRQSIMSAVKQPQLAVKIKRNEESSRVEKMQQRRHFVDSEFPHTNMSAGLPDSELVEWSPASRLIPFNNETERPVYSILGEDNQNAYTAFLNPDIKDAFYFMSVQTPHIVQEHLSKGYDVEGVYAYDMLNKGVVTRFTIDEYVPLLNWSIIYTPPKNNKLYPSMIEKAIAKNCGSYGAIPRRVTEIMEMLSCYPRKSIKVPREEAEAAFIGRLHEMLSRRNIVMFRAKDMEKLRVHGLEPNVYYLLKNLTYSQIDRSVLLCEIIQPASRQQDWNGRFSNTDRLWMTVRSSKTLRHSTLMSAHDMFRVADEFTVLHSTQNMGQTWIQNIKCRSRHSCFFQIQVPADTNIIIASYLKTETCRNNLILAAQLVDGYSYVVGCMEEWSNSNLIQARIQPGVYILHAKAEWMNQSQHGIFNIFAAFSEKVTIDRVDKRRYPNFLNLLFTQHSYRQNFDRLQVIRRQPLQFVSLRMMYDETGLAYLNVYISQESQITMIMEFDEKEFRQYGYKLKKPYGKIDGKQTLRIQPGNNAIIVCKVLCEKTHEKMLWPPPCLKIYQG